MLPMLLQMVKPKQTVMLKPKLMPMVMESVSLLA